MRMVNELKHLFLYPSNVKFYPPIDESDKKKNAAILLLSPDINTSIEMTRLPYMHNNNLFTAFYIDRDPVGLINNRATKSIIDNFDEVEAASLSEAMINSSTGNVKFKFDDKTSIMDEQYIRDVYNARIVKYYAKMLGIVRVPDKINVVVHPNLTDLRKHHPKYINQMDDDYYSYFDKGTIHVLSKMVYDPESMRGDYNTYLLIELLYAIMISYNEELAFVPTMGIAMAIAGLEKYKKDNRDNIINGGQPFKFAKNVNIIINRGDYSIIKEYIKTADMNIFAKYTAKNVVTAINKIIFESELSYSERQKLLPSDFAIPEKRKYPIHDEEHVRLAIAMFNKCDPDDEERLAEAIIKRINKFGILNIKANASNRFRKYYDVDKNKKKKIIREGSYHNRLPFSMYCPRSEFKELKNVDISSENKCGEIFIDDDGKLIAYYMTEKDENDNVWITDMMCYDGDGYSYLIGAAMDYQNAEFAKTDNDHLYDKLKSYGFNDICDDNGTKKMTIRESGEDFACNWEQIKYICSTLSNDELRRITFTDTYEDSKFVIKRLIARVGTSTDDGRPTFEPAGFLDVYQFPSCPDIAQIVIAVSSKCRGMGVARELVENLMKEELHKRFNFKMYYWTAHLDNYASQNLALGAGFVDTNTIDKYGRKVFIKPVTNEESPIIPFCNSGKFETRGNSIITESTAIFFEAETDKLDTRIGRFLYKERIKNDKEIILMYDRVKEENPSILRTYLKLKMYRNFNTFIDLSYYHGLFLRNNTFRMDNGLILYKDFLHILLHNVRIRNEYKKQTLFIPVKSGLWCDDGDLMDYKKHINPISLIIRLIRTDPGALRSLVDSGTEVLFVGDRGYFRLDLDKFSSNELTRFKTNITKLLSVNTPIMDEYEVDDNVNSKTAIANVIIDKIEKHAGITISDTRSARIKPSDMEAVNHLQISSKPMDIGRVEKDNGIVIISVDPDGPTGFNGLHKTPLAGVSNSVDMYCVI